MAISSAKFLALQNKLLAVGSKFIGTPYDVYRPAGATSLGVLNRANPLYSGTVNANMSKDYNYNHAPAWDDVLWATISENDRLAVGDILVGSLLYYVASMDPFLPLSCVRCNGTVSVLRQNSELSGPGDQPGVPTALPSQPGSQKGHYFGSSTTPVGAGQTGTGEVTLGAQVPACLVANAGRATGNGQLPDDAPGPSRWRIYLPGSVFPDGSLLVRDVVEDDAGNRYYVSSAQWSEMGYRLETIQLLN